MRALPPLVRLGLGLLAFGGAADIGYHAVRGLETHGHGGDGVAYAIHVVAAIGTALTVLGIVTAAVRSTRKGSANR